MTPKSWISGQSDILVLNDPEWPILPICNFSNLFPPKWLRIHNFANLFPLKWLRMTQNGQLCAIRNFSNFFPLKWLRMTRNGQFCMAKIKYILIQGNSYERLLFYMDGCALSPMASLLVISSNKNIPLLGGHLPFTANSNLNVGVRTEQVLL